MCGDGWGGMSVGGRSLVGDRGSSWTRQKLRIVKLVWKLGRQTG